MHIVHPFTFNYNVTTIRTPRWCCTCCSSLKSLQQVLYTNISCSRAANEQPSCCRTFSSRIIAERSCKRAVAVLVNAPTKNVKDCCKAKLQTNSCSVSKCANKKFLVISRSERNESRSSFSVDIEESVAPSYLLGRLYKMCMLCSLILQSEASFFF